MRWRSAQWAALLSAGVVAILVPTPRAGGNTARVAPGWMQIGTGPDGGTVWQGLIPNRFVRGTHRMSVAYLPPGERPGRRYPVVYLLQGFRGSPYQFSSGLSLASAADTLIATRQARPFIAVAPPAGETSHFNAEWAGPWESFLIRDVVPWVDTHLPVLASPAARTLAGLSAGGYGAVDIGLRHAQLFRTLEAWSGYFEPIRDGALRHADRRVLAAHDPSLLVRQEAQLLRRLGTRFFLSCGTTHDRITARGTRTFARKLVSLGLSHRLFLEPGGHDGKLWRRQLPAALEYAVGSD